MISLNKLTFPTAQLLLAFSAIVTWQSYLAISDTPVKSAYDSKREALYLPSGKGLHFISFGFRNILANVLWFNAINYFGKHYATDRNFKWLGHMCNLVTDLNPRALHVYHFGGMMLAWEANLPESSVELVTKGIKHLPSDWSLMYLRGFTYMYFLKDNVRAKEDFVAAAKLPNAPAFIATLASKKLADLNSPQQAITFLNDMIRNTTDATVRSALEARLKEAIFAFSLDVLEEKVLLFQARRGTLPQDLSELVKESYLPSLPKDPYGGEFIIEQGQIRSTSGRKRSKAYSSKTKDQQELNNDI